MRTSENRFLVIEQILRGAAKQIRQAQMWRDRVAAADQHENALLTIDAAAAELESIAHLPVSDKSDIQGPSDGWDALDWYFENVYSTDERIDGDAGVTLHWVNLRTNKAEQTKGANWRDAIAKAMRECAGKEGSEATT